MKPICILSACLLLTSFAAAQNAPTVKQAESACGSFHINFHVDESAPEHVLAPVVAGKAQIYVIEDFIQPPTFQIGHFAPTVRIGVDGQWVGADRGSSYLFLELDPGEHHLCVNWQSKFRRLSKLVSVTQLIVQPNRTYYFRARILTRDIYEGSSWYTLDLEPIDVDKAELLLAQYPHAKSSIAK